MLKKIKDPHAPKRPVPAFFNWSVEERKRIKVEQSQLSITDVSKLLGKRWEVLSPQIKEVYNDRYKEEKAAFDIVMANYQPSQDFLLKKAQFDQNFKEKNLGIVKNKTKKQLILENSRSVAQESVNQVENSVVKWQKENKIEEYFMFVAENWRVAAQNTFKAFPYDAAGPLEVEDTLHQMWGILQMGGGSNDQRISDISTQEVENSENIKTSQESDHAYMVFHKLMLKNFQADMPCLSLEDQEKCILEQWINLDEKQRYLFLQKTEDESDNLTH